jgi:serine/threonine protein kinase
MGHYCDIRPHNLLLDKNLDLKLADFQGKHLSADEEVLLNGFSNEPGRFPCPRDLPDYADVKTDLFALASIIYFIVMGYDAFPNVSDQDDGSDEVQRSLPVSTRISRKALEAGIQLCHRSNLGCRDY